MAQSTDNLRKKKKKFKSHQSREQARKITGSIQDRDIAESAPIRLSFEINILSK